MDPNANLREQLELAQEIVKRAASIEQQDMTLSPAEQNALRLAELVLALDEWIRKGGFLPRQWKWMPEKEGA